MNEKLPAVVADPSSIRIWFTQVYGKIGELEAAIFAQGGFLVFKTHTYSQDELMNHPLFSGIESLLGKIDDVVQSWSANENIDPDTVQFYHENRILIEQKLGNLRAEIIRRKPTFWEALLQTLESLIRKALKLLPALPIAFLERFGIQLAPLHKMLSDRSNEIDSFLDELQKK